MPDQAPQELPTNGRNAGQFRAGEPGPRLRFGHRSKLVAAGQLPEQAEALAALAETHAAIVNELGGPQAISTVRRDLITRYLQTSLIADYLSEHILAHGVMTTKGRTRAAVNTFLLVTDRQLRLAVAIGLERREKPTETFEGYLTRTARASQATVGEANTAAAEGGQG
ncbi:MAG: hypothetical protein H0X67_18005 [Acidobacteria bacterium]|nr:hypothetical protein [Acidobacteriota bacterium]